MYTLVGINISHENNAYDLAKYMLHVMIYKREFNSANNG